MIACSDVLPLLLGILQKSREPSLLFSKLTCATSFYFHFLEHLVMIVSRSECQKFHFNTIPIRKNNIRYNRG